MFKNPEFEADFGKQRPEFTRQAAETRSYLWKLNDGRYIPRPDVAVMTEDERAEHRTRVQQLVADGLL